MDPTANPNWGKTQRCTCCDPLTAAVIKQVGGTINHQVECPEIADDLTARYNAMRSESTLGEPPALNSDTLANGIAAALSGTATNSLE